MIVQSSRLLEASVVGCVVERLATAIVEDAEVGPAIAVSGVWLDEAPEEAEYPTATVHYRRTQFGPAMGTEFEEDPVFDLEVTGLDGNECELLTRQLFNCLARRQESIRDLRDDQDNPERWILTVSPEDLRVGLSPRRGPGGQRIYFATLTFTASFVGGGRLD